MTDPDIFMILGVIGGLVVGFCLGVVSTAILYRTGIRWQDERRRLEKGLYE